MGSREQWGSGSGFVLATVGAAVGLGNIWRFSYVAGENGGAVFLFLYLICILLVGLPLVVAELSIGRRAQGDAVTAFEIADNGRAGRYIGWIGVVGSTLILSYYAVIAGWALKYFSGAAVGNLWTAADSGYGAFFRNFIGDRTEPIVWQAAMLVTTTFIVAGGVRRGIEYANRWLMPILAVIVCLLAGYALSLPNAGAGVRFLFSPDWSALSKPSVYAAAVGQAFFSLGIGMAIFVTYGSYMPRTFSLPASATAIAFGDALFAIVAGLAIFPAVFSFGIDPTAGPELAFITLPQVFLSMPGGGFVGAIFFLLLSAAAFTSMVALLEVPVSMAVHRLNAPRWRASALVGGGAFLIGVPSAMSYGVLAQIQIGRYGILDAIDAGVSNFLLPTGGVLVALFVGWRLKPLDALRETGLESSRLGRVWIWLLRYLVPAAIFSVLIQSAGLL